MSDIARVVLGVDEHDVAEELMHFLDRTGRVRVVGTAGDDRQLAEAVRQLEPDAVVASPRLLVSADLDGVVRLAVDTSENVRALRTALRAGARGFYVWPGDRDELADAAARVSSPVRVSGPRARIVAVYGPRGGAGTTFVATHLASAFARLGRDCVLIDLDPLFGEVAAALGADEKAKSIGDLEPVAGEISLEHLGEVLWRHPQGFRSLLASGETKGISLAGAYASALEMLASEADVLVLHVPRMLGPIARAGLALSDRVLVVLSLDVMAFHDARRALAVMDAGTRCEFVVNRAARSELAVADIERVFGRLPIAVLPEDRAAAAAQDRGRLLPAKARTSRLLTELAGRLVEEANERVS